MSEEALVLAATQLLGERRSDDELATTEVCFQRCAACGYLRFPTAPVCPECLSSESEWTTDRGLGTIWSFCIYHRAFDPAFASAVPYNVALVELDSGPKLVSNVLGVVPTDLRIGMRVKAQPQEVAPGRYLLYFVPEGPRT
jgi:uncharacterized OB-fold protein